MALMLPLLEGSAVFAAVYLAAALSQPAAPQPPWWPPTGATWHALMVAACSVTAFHHWRLYERETARSLARSAPRVALGLAAAVAVVAAVHAVAAACPIPWCPLGPLALAGALASALALVLVMRAALFGWVERPRGAERVLIVGGSRLAAQLVDAIEAQPHGRPRVVGVVGESAAAAPSAHHLGTLADLDRILERVRPDRVVVALASRHGHVPFKKLLDLRVRGLEVEDGVDCYERLTGKVPIEALTLSSLVFSRDPWARRVDLAVAWALGVPTAVAALVLLAPVLALIALAIKLDSPGPVFFVQPRVGRGGRLFALIKFRTMLPAAGVTSEWARDNRGRLTRVGRWLRRYRLDELPQFVNVAKGEMNLVGPRPHPVTNLPLLVLVSRNTPECGEPIPFYALRSVVRPGITGWAQVRYRYANDLDEEIEKLRYDMYYIKHRSFALDLRILLETVATVLRGRESVERREAAVPSPAAMAAACAAPALRLDGALPPVETPLAPEGPPPPAAAAAPQRAARA